MTGYFNSFLIGIIFTAGLEANSFHYTKDVSYWGDKYASLGQSFTISCKLSVFDNSLWTKDGIILPKENEGFVQNSVKTDTNERILTLIVKEATDTSGGEYRCNRFDRKSHSINIITDISETRNISNTTFSSQILRVGERNKLRCPIESLETDTLNWYKNGIEVNPSSNLALQGRDVIILNGQPSDAGEYMCNVASEDEQLRNAHLVNLHYKAVVKHWSPQTEFIKDENVTLECVVHGYPFPKILWFVGNVKVSPRPPIRIVARKHGLQDTLQISHVQLSNTNLYTCHAENALGSDETSTILHVKESKIETNANKYSRELLMTLGKTLFLQCKTLEDPTWNVIWYKDGDNQVFDFNNDSRIEIFDENNTLAIHNTTEDDAGEYVCCTDINEANKIISATIIVKTRKLIASGEDSDGVVLLNLTLPLELSCSSTTGQDWDVLWYKNGVLLKEDIHVQINDTSNSLFIEKPVEEDAADYMCVVKANKVDILVNASVLVRTIPKIKPFATSENYYEGDLFMLHCMVTSGSPKLKITWYKDVEELEIYDVERHYVIISDERFKNAKFLIEEVQFNDRANYKCRVENEYGSDEVTILVRIKDRYAALWPFMGICVQMGILYTIITVHGRFSHPPHTDRRSKHFKHTSQGKSPRSPRTTASKDLA